MADGTCGVARSRAPASYAGGECVDEDARAPAEARARDDARKRADAEAESRAARYYTNGNACSSRPGVDAGSCGRGGGAFGQSVDLSNRAEVDRLLARLAVLDAAPSTSPDEHAWLRSLVPHLRAAKDRFAAEDKARAAQATHAESRAAAEKSRIDSVVHPHRKPDTLDRLGDEILRLRAIVPAPADAALKQALAARVAELTNDWCAKARAAGMAPPPNGFTPYAASDRELKGAFLWMTVAGVVPLDAASHDGGLELREDMLEAVALRTPGLGEQLIESYASDPGAQRVLLERELFRLGQPMCSASETNEQLIVRRAQLLRKDHEAVNAPDPKQRTIGLDGLQGTLQTAVDYEIEQRILAMNPGTTTGAIAATAFRNGSVEDMRAAGTFGNAVEGIAGAVAGVDPGKLEQGPAPGMRGRRRTPPGPGFGRRTRVAEGRTRVAARTGAMAPARTTAAQSADRPDIAGRTPTAINDKHILNGEVSLDQRGRPYATGFHHQASGTEGSARLVPGTEWKPNRFGVYRADVEIRDPATGQWLRKAAFSTFFPKHWTRSEVRTSILEAFANREDFGNGRWRGQLKGGMTIEGYVDASGRVTTAYPVME